MTIEQNRLLLGLAEGLPIQFGVSVTEASGDRLVLSDGQQLQSEVIVVADGRASSTRALLGGGTAQPTQTNWCYSAVVCTSLEDPAFETLGAPGTRFAAVPLANQRSFWFATVPHRLPGGQCGWMHALQREWERGTSLCTRCCRQRAQRL
eukprot:TRINITY_DN10876_c0_g1_i3.p1 TRINITY_DN10876_c0_g1~~TRINITY_DN10876_c0_g1_i3.p1  ORF type:complete len:150 (-),score=38.83 TRINITY_DN10876_c0_g1_i3:489-938(-)